MGSGTNIEDNGYLVATLNINKWLSGYTMPLKRQGAKCNENSPSSLPIHREERETKKQSGG
jgi:hypothetical protein